MQSPSMNMSKLPVQYLRLAFWGVLVFSVFGPLEAVQADTQKTFFECNLTHDEQSKFWVSEKMGIVILDEKRVTVSDGASLAYGVSPLDARVVRNTDKELRLEWQLEGGLRQSGERMVLIPNAEYTAKLTKATNALSVRGKLKGMRQRFSGKGACVVKQKR